MTHGVPHGHGRKQIRRGGRVLPAAVAERLAQFVPRIELTEREREVLSLMAKGLQNSQIAREIGRSEATVKIHVHHVLSKLGASDRTEAVVVGLQRGIIHLS